MAAPSGSKRCGALPERARVDGRRGRGPVEVLSMWNIFATGLRAILRAPPSLSTFARIRTRSRQASVRSPCPAKPVDVRTHTNTFATGLAEADPPQSGETIEPDTIA